jgi:protein-S-isoprenylcysteine O-methyltransferase Ste14
MKRLYPPSYLLIAIVLMVALHFLLPVRQIIFFPWRLLGILPLLAGILLAVLAERTFKKHRTTVKPFEKSSALVTDGAFRLSRHPMYLGMTLLLAGLAVLMGSVTPWCGVLLFVLVMEFVFVRAEEAMMDETFGQAYRDYRAQVRRWL